MLPHRRTAKLRGHRGRELAMSHARGHQRSSYVGPYLFWHGIEIRVTSPAFELAQYFARGDRLDAVHSDVMEKSRLIVSAVDVQMPPVAVAGLLHSFDPAENPDA